MAATKKFIRARVGDKGANGPRDVLAVQQLLVAAGEQVPGGADGKWGSNTAKALDLFQKRQLATGTKLPLRPYVEPDDYCLLLMAYRANILIPLKGKTGLGGIKDLHEWFNSQTIKYNAGADKGRGNRAIYGMDGRTDYAVQTISRGFYAGPVEMDCTTYVNLMLSIYLNGQAHGVPYDADCSKFGGISTVHCARDRYRLPLVQRTIGTGKAPGKAGFFETAEQIRLALVDSGTGLFVLEVGAGEKGGVTHMALLVGNPYFEVYECTTKQKGSACIQRSLEAFLENKKGVPIYMFGPSA